MMLEQHIEALIFASEKPVTPKEIKACLQEAFGWEVNDEEFEKAVEAIKEKYLADGFSFQLVMTGGGYEFMTKKDFAPLINTFLNQKAKKRLTRAALETLSIIAYKQPVTKAEIEQIRGVNCDYAVQKLLEKELIVIAGRAETVGHPLTYSTSEQFMDYFGINSPADLPKLREIEAGHENEIGPAPEVEEVREENAASDETQPEQQVSDEFSAENTVAESETPAEEIAEPTIATETDVPTAETQEQTEEEDEEDTPAQPHPEMLMPRKKSKSKVEREEKVNHGDI